MEVDENETSSKRKFESSGEEDDMTFTLKKKRKTLILSDDESNEASLPAATNDILPPKDLSPVPPIEDSSDDDVPLFTSKMKEDSDSEDDDENVPLSRLETQNKSSKVRSKNKASLFDDESQVSQETKKSRAKKGQKEEKTGKKNPKKSNSLPMMEDPMVMDEQPVSGEDLIEQPLNKSGRKKPRKDVRKTRQAKKSMLPTDLNQDEEVEPIELNMNIFDTQDSDDDLGDNNYEENPENVNGDENFEENSLDEKKKKPAKTKEKKAPKEPSERKREKELLRIRSENQRLLRDMAVKLPYRKSANYSLDEYLKNCPWKPVAQSIKATHTDVPSISEPTIINNEQSMDVCLSKSIDELSLSTTLGIIEKGEDTSKENRLDTVASENISEETIKKINDTEEQESEDALLKKPEDISEELIGNTAVPEKQKSEVVVEANENAITEEHKNDNILTEKDINCLYAEQKEENAVKPKDNIRELRDGCNENTMDMESPLNTESITQSPNIDTSKETEENILKSNGTALTPRERYLAKKQKLLKDAMSLVPRLSCGASDEVIVFEDGVKSFQRYFTSHIEASSKKKRETLEEIKSKEVEDLNLAEIYGEAFKSEELTAELPGSRFEKFKQSLLNNIMLKKEEAFNKQLEQEQIGEEAVPEEEEEEEEAELTDGSDTEQSMNEDEEEEEEEDDITIVDKRKRKSYFLDEEASVTDEEVTVKSDGLSNSSKSSRESLTNFAGIFPKKDSELNIPKNLTQDEMEKEEDAESRLLYFDGESEDNRIGDVVPVTNSCDVSLFKIPPYQPFGGFPQRSNEELQEESGIISPQDLQSVGSQPLWPSQDPSPDWKRMPASPRLSLLLENAVDPNQSYVSEEEFPKADIDQEKAAKELFFSNTQPDINDVLGLCSGTFSTQQPTQSQRILSDDEDSNFNKANVTANRKKPQVLSDSEDDDEEEEEDNNRGMDIKDYQFESEEEGDNLDPNDEVLMEEMEGFMDNQTTKKQNEFFEDEAELSGSDVGSDDEDEEDADQDAYLEDLIHDGEKYSEEDLRNQIGKVHLKELMDEDKRQLRLYQELYLENGDLHHDGPGRQRKFAWRNIGAPVIEKDGNESGSDQEEPETEEKWRMERFEREKWLREHADEFQEDPSVTPIDWKARKVKIENGFKNFGDPSAPVPTVREIPSYYTRGSFLARGTEFLESVAKKFKFKKDEDPNREGSRTTKHFVWRKVSPKKESPAKTIAPKKPKPKPQTGNRKSLLDLLDE